jgi:hypothetical protein
LFPAHMSAAGGCCGIQVAHVWNTSKHVLVHMQASCRPCK